MDLERSDSDSGRADGRTPAASIMQATVAIQMRIGMTHPFPGCLRTKHRRDAISSNSNGTEIRMWNQADASMLSI